MRYRVTVGGQLSGPDGQDAAAAEDRVFGYIERFAAVLVAAGFPPMAARVFVALVISEDGRLSAAELAERLRISAAAVSGAVRYLIQVGLVHKERVPGSRRDYYRTPGNLWDDLLRMRDQVMSRWAALVREGIDLVGPDTAAGARMAEQAAFLEFASREMADLLTRWEKYQAEERRG
jgi:DNA-binding transcriptional regulator GbsR (MarR family)